MSAPGSPTAHGGEDVNTFADFDDIPADCRCGWQPAQPGRWQRVQPSAACRLHRARPGPPVDLRWRWLTHALEQIYAQLDATAVPAVLGMVVRTPGGEEIQYGLTPGDPRVRRYVVAGDAAALRAFADMFAAVTVDATPPEGVPDG